MSGDYVILLDHTIQQDSMKMLFIIGIRLEDLPPVGEAVTLENVKPLALYPVEKSSGEIVYQQLEETVTKIGVPPRAILSDAGSDLKKGADLFCEKYTRTDSFYDITHKNACVLKHYLEKDEVWLTFCNFLTSTRRLLQQTSLAQYLPPTFKTKARYMNLDTIVLWGNRIIAAKGDILTTLECKNRELYLEKLSWIDSFKAPLLEWKEMLDVTKTAEEFIRKRGIFSQAELFLQQLPSMNPSSPKAQEISKELVQFVQLQSLKVTLKERLPGTTEVLESVFGKFKRIEKDQIKNGFTSMILALPAMLSKTTKEIVTTAMKQVSTKMPRLWSNDNLGQTGNAKKLEFHKTADKAILLNSQEVKGTKTGSVVVSPIN